MANTSDQAVVSDYLASEAYARAATRRRRVPLAEARAAWPDRVLAPTVSFLLGWLGLGLLLIPAAAIAPIASSILESIVDSGFHYVWYLILQQTFVYPAMVCFVFALLTPMFWYGSVVARFAMAAIAITPGVLAYTSIAGWLDPSRDSLWTDVLTTLLAVYVITGALAVLLQMWSRWTLSHSRPIEHLTAPTGSRAIMELTGVAAVCYAVLFSLDVSDRTEELLLMSSMAGLMAVAALSTLIAFLRVESRNVLSASVAWVFLYGATFSFAGMHAFAIFGWAEVPNRLSSIAGVALYGTVVAAVAHWVCLEWLRGCGWICLSREEERRIRDRGPEETWKWFSQRDPESEVSEKLADVEGLDG